MDGSNSLVDLYFAEGEDIVQPEMLDVQLNQVLHVYVADEFHNEFLMR